MKIRAIKITDFKRFHNLTITNIPDAKLVVLAGPNGYGKSSLFDAFLSWHRTRCNMGRNQEADYYLRTTSDVPHFDPGQKVQLQLYPVIPTDPQKLKGCFYIRSAYRNDPDFTTRNIQQQASRITHT
jgi:energy-coupling factor transporter ATP-binding protein EcfA2